jgi:hypothetical protein
MKEDRCFMTRNSQVSGLGCSLREPRVRYTVNGDNDVLPFLVQRRGTILRVNFTKFF